MLKLGLTGGIAGGKSTARKILEKFGAKTLDADLLARRLMSPGEAAYAAVVERFGRDILTESGEIDRRRLSALVFPKRKDELNALVHPLVLATQEHWMESVGEQFPKAICVVEAALLIEAGGYKKMDKLLVIACPNEQERLARYVSRSGLTLPEAKADMLRRLAAQMPEAEKAARADYVIENTGSTRELENRLSELWPRLQALA